MVPPLQEFPATSFPRDLKGRDQVAIESAGLLLLLFGFIGWRALPFLYPMTPPSAVGNMGLGSSFAIRQPHFLVQPVSDFALEALWIFFNGVVPHPLPEFGFPGGLHLIACEHPQKPFLTSVLCFANVPVPPPPRFALPWAFFPPPLCWSYKPTPFFRPDPPTLPCLPPLMTGCVVWSMFPFFFF